MHITRAGRIVFVGQWIAAIILPIWFFFGRGLVGAEIGLPLWALLVYGVVVVAVLLVPPVITLFDGEVRRERSTRLGYTVASGILWIAVLLAALVVTDQADGAPLDSALSAWTDDALTQQASDVIFVVLAGLIGLAYLAVFVLAMVGVTRSREASATD